MKEISVTYRLTEEQVGRLERIVESIQDDCTVEDLFVTLMISGSLYIINDRIDYAEAVYCRSTEN